MYFPRLFQKLKIKGYPTGKIPFQSTVNIIGFVLFWRRGLKSGLRF